MDGAAAKDPGNLPHDVLYRDFIRRKSAQNFLVKAEPGEYRVYVLHPDRSDAVLNLKAEGGLLSILAQFKTIENAANNPSFLIPGDFSRSR